MIKVNPENPDIEKIRVAANIIQKGGLVAFPTETVYGLGADALNTSAVVALFKAKNRPLDNPPIIHIAEESAIYPLVAEVSPAAELLMRKFWPGPLTLIFKRSKNIPDITVAGLDTIAIRMPNHKIALQIIKHSNRPIAAPSANLATKPSPTTAQHVYEDLNGKIDAIIDGGAASIGVESTVIDLSSDKPVLLRPGGIPFEVLKRELNTLELHPFVSAECDLPLDKICSPGMKHKHYAPKAEVILVEGNLPDVVNKIKELSKNYMEKNLKVGILATDETCSSYIGYITKSMGSRFNLPVVASNLFRLLREVDSQGVDVILAESVSTEGLGLAVMNRLRKASCYHIIKAS